MGSGMVTNEPPDTESVGYSPTTTSSAPGRKETVQSSDAAS